MYVCIQIYSILFFALNVCIEYRLEPYVANVNVFDRKANKQITIIIIIICIILPIYRVI